MAILERVRRGRGPAGIGQLAKDIRDDLGEDLPAIRQEALGVVERVLDAASKAVESAAEDAAKAAEAPASEVTSAAGDALARATGMASRTGDSIGQSIARAGRELNLDGRIDDVAKRIRRELSSERLTSLVAGLERELPTTDRDRYDRAYARGWTRARTSFVGVGLLAGIMAGVAGAFLLDPARGAQRRAAIGDRARSVGADASKVVGARATAVSERVRSIAAERGLRKDGATADVTAGDPGMTAPGLVPVMDTASTSAPSAAITDDVVTDPAATAAERMTAEGGPVDETAGVPTA